MRYENNERLREYLDRGAAGAYREHLRHPRFEFDDEAFAASLDQVCAQFPGLSLEEAEARAAFRLLTSGVAPEVASPLPSPWFRTRTFVREKSARSWPWLKLAWAIAVLVLCATAVALLSALVVRAEPTPSAVGRQAIRKALRGFSLLAAPQQPGGIILQFQQGGSPLATRPAGLLAFNCGSGMSCSFTGSTFTLTSTGAGGGGCTPPGTPTRILYDDGASGCLDSGLTWTSGTSTAAAPSGVTLTYSGTGIINVRKINSTEFTNGEGLGKIPIGQGDGTAVWADPLVQGLTAHDAVGTSTNPVLTGGYASGTAPTDVSNDGDAVRAWFLRNGSQVVNLASGGSLVALGQKTMASSLPVAIASDQSAVTVTQSAPASLRTQLYGFDGAAVQAVSTSGGGILSTLQSLGALGDGETNVGRLGAGANQAILGNAPYMYNGTNWDRLRGSATDGLLVNLGANNDVTVTGTVTATATDLDIRNLATGQDKVDVRLRNAADSAFVEPATLGEQQTQTTSLQTLDNIVSGTGVNVSQINGVAPLMGNGGTGTGSPRVTIASDNSNSAGIGGSATGSAVPSAARYIGGNGTGNLVGYLNCDNTAVYDAATNGSTQLVALTSSQIIYVCGYQISQSTTTSVSVNLRYGTGSNCATGPANITPSYPLQAVTSTGPIGMVVMTPGFTGLKTAASNALCINTNAAVSVQAIVWYTKF